MNETSFSIFNVQATPKVITSCHEDELELITKETKNTNIPNSSRSFWYGRRDSLAHYTLYIALRNVVIHLRGINSPHPKATEYNVTYRCSPGVSRAQRLLLVPFVHLRKRSQDAGPSLLQGQLTQPYFFMQFRCLRHQFRHDLPG